MNLLNNEHNLLLINLLMILDLTKYLLSNLHQASRKPNPLCDYVVVIFSP